MTTHDDLDHRLKAWFEGEARATGSARTLEAVLEATRARTPRPAWAVALRGGRLSEPAGGEGRRTGLGRWPVIALAILTVLALVAGVVVVGARLASPQRVATAEATSRSSQGPARNGVISYSMTADGALPHLHFAGPDGRERGVQAAGDIPGLCSAFSPDGRQMAFLSTEGRALSAIVLAGSDGSGPRDLVSLSTWTTGQLPTLDQRPLSWSPDGGSIAFGTQVISVRDGSSKTALPTGATNPAWSPDGRRIAFTTITGSQAVGAGIGTIWIVDADGSNRRALTSFPVESSGEAISPVSWSPDGSLLAYNRFQPGTTIATFGPDGGGPTETQGRHVFVIGISGGVETELTHDLFVDVIGVAFSPDGSRIGFSARWGTGGFSIESIRPNGTDLRSHGATQQPRALVWSPDSTRILVTYAQPTGLPMDSMPADGTGPTITIGGPGRYEYCWPSWQRLP